jgi:hypothetical protein
MGNGGEMEGITTTGIWSKSPRWIGASIQHTLENIKAAMSNFMSIITVGESR